MVIEYELITTSKEHVNSSMPAGLTSLRGFQFIGGSLALDFINTVANRLGDRREDLTSISQVTRWARRAGLISPHQVIAIPSSRLAELVAAREELYALFRPIALGSPLPRRALEQLNLRLAEISSLRKIRRNARSLAWCWDTDLSQPEHLLGPILWDAADLLISGKFARIKQCSDEHCGWLFLDRSQTGKRRWCSMADCGNRYKACRFYRRRQHIGS